MKQAKTRTIAYLALYVALYVLLKFVGNLIPVLQMPNGGSIELELIAVFICSYQMGWKWGVADAVLSWLISIVLGFEMWFVTFPQILLDYVLPLVVCGLASALWPFRKMSRSGSIVFGIVLGAAAFFGISKSWNGTAAYVVGALVGAGICAFTVWYLAVRDQFGIVISMILKYVFQMLSGVYFWFPEGAAAGSSAAWSYSIGYNLWYNLVTMIVCIIVVPMLVDRLKKAKVPFAA